MSYACKTSCAKNIIVSARITHRLRSHHVFFQGVLPYLPCKLPLCFSMLRH